MVLLRTLMLRRRARKAALHLLRFAERLRKRDSEFAPTYRDTLETLGDELAVMARDHCRNDAERRALLLGLTGALEQMYRNDPALTLRVAGRLAPRVMSACPRVVDGNPMNEAVH
jgi:hypothetical protein